MSVSQPPDNCPSCGKSLKVPPHSNNYGICMEKYGGCGWPTPNNARALCGNTREWHRNLWGSETHRFAERTSDEERVRVALSSMVPSPTQALLALLAQVRAEVTEQAQEDQAVYTHQIEAERDALRDAVRDIDAHATPVGAGEVPDYYAVSVGSLHRALGLVGAAAKCRDLPCPQAAALWERVQVLEAAIAKYRDDFAFTAPWDVEKHVGIMRRLLAALEPEPAPEEGA